MHDITDEYTAYCFDEVVAVFGSWVEDQLSEVEGKTLQERKGTRALLLKKLLDDNPAARYATPVATA